MRLPNNNSCFTKKKKQVTVTKCANKHVEISLEGDQNNIKDEDHDLENDEYNEVLFEDIKLQNLSSKEKTAPIVSPEDVSFVNMEDSTIMSEFESSTEQIIQKSDYVLSKVKKSQFGIRWSVLTDVVNTNIKGTMNGRQIFLQEAMFEVISSEAKYFAGLEILVNHFKKSYLFSPLNDKVGYVNPIDKFHIFSNISNIMEASRRLLTDLELRWIRDKPILKDVCDILYEHASSQSFYSYVIYISNQNHQLKEFERLMESEFIKKELMRLESFEISKNLPLSSYLLLPFQRLTRLKLLSENISKGLLSDDIDKKAYASQIQSAKMASHQFENLLMISQKGRVKRNLQELVFSLKEKLDFQNTCKIIDIRDKCLLKEGEFESIPLKKKTKSKKKNPTVILLLFADIMMIGKRNGSRLQILDYCSAKDINLTNVEKVKKKKKVENPDLETIKMSLSFKNSCSGFLDKPVILVSDRSGYFDEWRICLPGQNELDKEDKLSNLSQRQWQSVKKSIVKLNV